MRHKALQRAEVDSEAEIRRKAQQKMEKVGAHQAELEWASGESKKKRKTLSTAKIDLEAEVRALKKDVATSRQGQAVMQKALNRMQAKVEADAAKQVKPAHRGRPDSPQTPSTFEDEPIRVTPTNSNNSPRGPHKPIATSNSRMASCEYSLSSC